MKTEIKKEMKKERYIDTDKVFLVVNAILLGIIIFMLFYPLYLIFIASLSEPSAVINGEVLLFPKGNNLKGFQRVFADGRIARSYLNTIIITALGTFCNLVMTVPAAYVLATRQFMLKRFVMILILITMFFSGGMIPTFLLVKNLGLLDSWWALILPGVVSSWNLIVCKTFFENQITGELTDAAMIDGANHWQIFSKIALPLSSVILTILGLFYGVEHWNSYWSALLYIKDQDKYPLQMILRDILLREQISVQMMQEELTEGNTLAKMSEIAESVKYVVAVIASLPIIIIFPFVEKYFVQGIMIGSVKG